MKSEDITLRKFLEQFARTAEMDQRREWAAPMKV